MIYCKILLTIFFAIIRLNENSWFDQHDTQYNQFNQIIVGKCHDKKVNQNGSYELIHKNGNRILKYLFAFIETIDRKCQIVF